MKPCVICGTMIKKKDSVMTIDYVCSENCKNKRKSLLPKKVSVTSWRYWVEQGMTETEARIQVSKIQSERSPRCVEYWILKGCSKEEARQKVFEYQQANGLRNLEKYSREERQKRTPFSKKYWIEKGYSEEEAREILSKNADGLSLDYHVSKYGATRGKELYAEMCRYRKKEYTLAAYQQKNGSIQGKRLWSKKYKNRHNSKKACEFFKKLSMHINDRYKIYTAGNNHGEYGVLNKDRNEYYFYDFVIPELKLCVEYHGDYWHCNPKKYDALYEHKQSGLTAKDIWEKDKIKLDTIVTERGFDVIVVWESDNLQEKITFIMEKIDEFEKSQNQK